MQDDYPNGILAATEVIDNIPTNSISIEMFADGENGTVLKITFDQTKAYNANTYKVTTTTTDDEGNEVTTTTFFTIILIIWISACKEGRC